MNGDKLDRARFLGMDRDTQRLTLMQRAPQFAQLPRAVQDRQLEELARRLQEPAAVPEAAAPRKTGVAGEVQRLNQGLSELREEAGRGIKRVLAGGRPEAALAGEVLGTFLNPMPGSLGDIAMMAVNPVIALSPVGGVKKAVTTGLADYALSGGDPLAALTGTAAGGLGALAYAATQPNKATHGLLRAGRAIRDYGSPALSKALAGYEANPRMMTESATLLKMRRGASAEIGEVLTGIGDAIGEDVIIDVPSLDVPTAAKAGLSMRTDALTGRTIPAGTYPDVMKAIHKLKRNDDPMGWRAERDLVEFLDRAQPELVPAYRVAVKTYRTDMRMVDFVEALQKARELPGGVNPSDFAGLAEAAAQLYGKRSPVPGQALYHGAGAALEGATPWGMTHLAGLARAAMAPRGSPIARQPIGLPRPLRVVGGKAAAAGASELGPMVGGALEPREPTTR